MNWGGAGGYKNQNILKWEFPRESLFFLDPNSFAALSASLLRFMLRARSRAERAAGVSKPRLHFGNLNYGGNVNTVEMLLKYEGFPAFCLAANTVATAKVGDISLYQQSDSTMCALKLLNSHLCLLFAVL